MFQAGSPSIGVSRGERQGGVMIRLLVGIIGLGALATAALAADPVEIGIGYLHPAGIKPTLSLVEQPAENDGVAGPPPPVRDKHNPRNVPNHRLPPERRWPQSRG